LATDKQVAMDPTLRFLFRYRDLVADTLPEHRRILEDKGWCWWGWWKRPNEPSRLDIWQEIQRETEQGHRVQIGLFHSGKAQVHLAIVDQVVLPVEDEFGQCTPVLPPPSEQDGIPAYYRESRYSRSWMRLVLIAEDPISFFGSFSYAIAPPLPNYPERQLDRLAGKRITDADELRAMDTTIWVVRPSLPHDSSERFFTAMPSHDDPLSAQPVVCAGEWLLHLTDPHYAVGGFRKEHQWRLESETENASPTMVDAINEALRRSGRSVGAVLVTGDLTYIASPEEFNAAHTGLFKLTNGLLGLNIEHLIVVPGNHDIAWTRNDSYDYGATVTVAPDEATANYRQFFRGLYGFEASPQLSMARRLIFPGGNLVDVVAVNSSSLEQGKSFLAGMGRVQEVGYRDAAGALSWHNHGGLGLRILALHHHLALTEDLESPDEYRSGFGIAIDAPRVQRMAANNGVHLAIHGHKHRAFVWRTGAYPLPEYSSERWELGSFNIVGGGSCGSRSTDGGRNFFNLIRVQGSRVDLEMYRCQNRGSFERFMTWHADLNTTSDADALTIGPWRQEPA
jgi:predicted phosphodiesterase